MQRDPLDIVWRAFYAVALAAVLALALVQVSIASDQSSVWLSPGAVSWHADRGANYNERNRGIGVEWQSATREHRIAAGTYRNSIRRDTRYAMYSWMPFATELGPVRLSAGVGLGLADGYKVNEGRFFPVALPIVSIDYGPLGINLSAWPKLEKQESAGVAIQLRVRVW